MIKFRGIPLRDADDIYEIADYDGTFVYGYYIKNGDGAMIVGDQTEELDDVGLSRWFEDVVPETVGQFTGLKDVNGKEIYIGDIVKVWSDMSELTMVPVINEIVSEDLFGRPGVFLKPAGPHLIEPCLHDSWNNQFEVIGNVHENPELLKG
ncbi:YopX family protein [Lactiplantibacillus plantarum]|uniref:YopX family protein n=1 Tax=Lactiplantibacillus plantarum TaxID=1590 RepID=UPI003F52E131